MTQVRNSYQRDITECGFGKSCALLILTNWHKPILAYLWVPPTDNQSPNGCVTVTKHSVGKMRGEELVSLPNIPKIW